MQEKRQLGKRFNILSELSCGGFGQTYLAEDCGHPGNPKCVIKQLKPSSDEPKIIDLARRLFEQEVQVLYQVGRHPQIPTLVTHFEEDGEFYLVQEYIEGETFEEELNQGRIYSQNEVINITQQLLEVLAFVHRHNVIHRDVKPSNLIRRKQDGKLVLIDFGAVKQVRNHFVSPHQPTQGTIAIGSNGYMPMEQLAGHPRFCSDVYAAGMFAIQLLTQTHPTHFRQNQRTGEWVWQDKASVNPHLAELLNQMIRFDFRQRFPGAMEALNAFKRLGLYTQGVRQEGWNQNQRFNNRQNDLTQVTFTPPIPPFHQSQDATKHINNENTGYAPPPQLQFPVSNQPYFPNSPQIPPPNHPQGYFPQQPYPNQQYQQRVQPYPINPVFLQNGQPQQMYRRTYQPIEIDKNQLGKTENITLRGFGVKDWSEEPIFRGLGFIFLVIFLIWFLYSLGFKW